MQRKVFIIGCGYVGLRLGRALQCDSLLGLVRTTSRIKPLRAAGIEPIVVDLDRVAAKQLSQAWFRDSIVVYLAPPPTEGESDTRLHRLLNMIAINPRAFIYLSTTGVYGNTNGQLVNESAAINPQTKRARRRVSAEEMVRTWCTERQVRRVILRVPAIYGPGRLPLDKLRAGEPVLSNAISPIINRIHVDDLVQVLIAAGDNPQAMSVYNVSDGNALTMTEYLRLVAQLAQLPAPTEISWEEAALSFSSEYLSYLSESRHIDNRRMLQELGVTLRYADVADGIRASLEEAKPPRRRDPTG